jgi:hypothetical protein
MSSAHLRGVLLLVCLGHLAAAPGCLLTTSQPADGGAPDAPIAAPPDVPGADRPVAVSDGAPDQVAADPGAPFDTGGDVSTADAGPADTAPGLDGAPADLADQVVSVDLSPGQVLEQVAAVRASLGQVQLRVEGVWVTYLLPQAGADPASDPAGFFVQAEDLATSGAAGDTARASSPALFLAVDPAHLSPLPRVGDRVAFTVLETGQVRGQKRVLALSEYVRLEGAMPGTPEGLTEDVSRAADLVSQLDARESRLISLTGTVRGPFLSAGSGFIAAPLDTAALSGAPGLQLRVPVDLAPQVGAEGCRVTLTATPLWRQGRVAQAAAWNTADIVTSDCPPPRVVSAEASAPDQVLIRFSAPLDRGTVLATGEQFTFTGGLAALDAQVPLSAPDSVVISTSSQSPGADYQVTVAGSVQARGVGVDPAAATATFAAYVPRAQLVLNEVNPNIATGADLIELRAVTAGPVEGVTIEQDLSADGTPVTVLATLPRLQVQIGDLIVIHLRPGRSGGAVIAESGDPGECTDPACYPGAWDVPGNDVGITFGDRVLFVRDLDGGWQDAVAFSRGQLTCSDAFLAQVGILQSGFWLPDSCGGHTCSCDPPTVLDLTVDWSGAGNAPGGASLQRTSNEGGATPSDWSLGPETFGRPN